MFRRRPIISNRYAQFERFPSHTRGPNYTRPVFDEYGPYGNFQPAPIFVMPGVSLNGSEAPMKRGGIFGKNALGIGFMDELFGEDTEGATVAEPATAEGGTAAGAKILEEYAKKKTTAPVSTGKGGASAAATTYSPTQGSPSIFDNPMTWVVLAAVGAVGVYYATKKK